MIVVTGASGNVGSRVVETLAASGEQVAAMSRRPQPGDSPAGVRRVPGDLAEPGGLREAFDGADALFLLVAGDDPHAVLDAAKTAGVRRVVLLSSQGAGTRPEAYAHPAAFEAAVRGSGLEWTVLRPSGFATNSLGWAESVRAERTVVAPFGDVALPVIDPADIAATAAAVLAGGGEGHAGRTYVLTGPAAVTPREQARAIGAALGEEVRFVEQSRDEARTRMLTFMPEPVVDATLGILGTPLPAEQAVSGDVERLLGRPAGSFADWAAAHAPAFR
ncbi:NAD(P)H-binding protein [Streptomyces sp. NRRL F-5123]|uniref:NAD(P)H-binding protein n=1 Tax=Streptomyces sp. NRRL F-5123 TaxID=1463856 RepID=UPI0004E23FA1|nr:NAD(P)H-binding protein [Streptomyces sp. NRRL F-5123]